MQVDLDAEVQKRKEKILTLKSEIDAIKKAKEVLEGKSDGTAEPTEHDKQDE